MPYVATPERYRDGWRIRWTDEYGRRRCEVWPEWKEAAFRLRQHQQRVEEVRRRLRAASPRDRTFGEACEYWLAHRAKQKRSGKGDESIIGKHLRPAFGALRLAEVTTERVDEFVLTLGELALNTRRNILGLLNAILNMVLKRKW
jgi:hypothetical protein